MLLHRLLGGNDTAFLHQFVDPGDPSTFESLQHLILHFKIFINRNTVLYHLVDTGILFHKSRLHQPDHRMGITFVIIGSFCPLDHADVEQHHFPAHPVDLFLSHLNIPAPHDVIVDFLQLGR